MVAQVGTVALLGFEGAIVEVETDIKQGLPAMHIVGMGNKAIDEARERVRSALNNSLLDFPTRKVIVNLAPAELPKDGAHFDLPIALSIMVASGQLQQRDIIGSAFAGELSLGGELRPIRGALVIAEAAKKAGYVKVFVPLASAAQASLIEGIDVIAASTLKEVFLHLKNETPIPPSTPQESSNHLPTPLRSMIFMDKTKQNVLYRLPQLVVTTYSCADHLVQAKQCSLKHSLASYHPCQNQRVLA